MSLHKFIFIHVPKTAGTSFRENILKPLYRDKFYYDKTMTLDKKEKVHNIKNDLILYNWGIPVFPENYKSYDVIGGHFSFDKYAHLNLSMITFLRDPIERLISHYHFYKDASRLYMDMPIIKFAEVYANFMTRQLGPDLSKMAFVGFTEYYNESVSRFNNKFGLNPPENKNKQYRKDTVNHTITGKERKIITELNEDDYKLYQDALNEFNKGV